MHANFDTTFPPGSVARRQKISGLTSSYEQRRRQMMFRAWTDQERATAASLRVAWILGEKEKAVYRTFKSTPIAPLRVARILGKKKTMDELTDDIDVAHCNGTERKPIPLQHPLPVDAGAAQEQQVSTLSNLSCYVSAM